jgi:hypothetical protein
MNGDSRKDYERRRLLMSANVPSTARNANPLQTIRRNVRSLMRGIHHGKMLFLAGILVPFLRRGAD